MSDQPHARLALEDGSVFHGRGFGACASPTTSTGEVVFNTAMTGYQEAITDPSYAGQILTMTAPLIGNYGINPEDLESDRPHIAGFVIRERARRVSNHRATTDLHTWLAEHGIPAIEGIDTRALVRRLRIEGALRGVLTSDPTPSDADLIAQARAITPMSGQNLASEVSPAEACGFDEDLGDWGEIAPPAGERRFRVLAIDCGGKRNIYRHLVSRGCVVERLPASVTAEAIRARIADGSVDGLFISNGPGDPAAVAQTIETLRAVAGEVPTFGICLGHQLLALALGARTYKLKFGHRGANQPVRNLFTGRVEITSQNHGFCVDAEHLPEGCEATHIHLNDGTLAGLTHRSRPILSVQHHPEASPGPHDAGYLFDWFIMMMTSGKPLDVKMAKAASLSEVPITTLG